MNSGVGRRFQRYAKFPLQLAAASPWLTTTVITRRDEGHDCRGARAFPDRRLMLAFQPHRYSRTRDCFEDFVAVLNGVDALVLAEVLAPVSRRWLAATVVRCACARVAGKIEPSLSMISPTCRKPFWIAARDGDGGDYDGAPVRLAAYRSSW